jgi:hypothetical protein
MSTLTELGAHLVTKNIGALGTSLFLDHMPMGVENAVSVVHMSAASPIRAMGASLSAPVADVPAIQVVVRNASHSDGEAKVKAVIDALDFYSGTLGSTKYLLVTLEYGPVYVGLDENNRHRWSIAFRAVKRRS